MDKFWNIIYRQHHQEKQNYCGGCRENIQARAHEVMVIALRAACEGWYEWGKTKKRGCTQTHTGYEKS